MSYRKTLLNSTLRLRSSALWNFVLNVTQYHGLVWPQMSGWPKIWVTFNTQFSDDIDLEMISAWILISKWISWADLAGTYLASTYLASQWYSLIGDKVLYLNIHLYMIRPMISIKEYILRNEYEPTHFFY